MPDIDHVQLVCTGRGAHTRRVLARFVNMGDAPQGRLWREYGQAAEGHEQVDQIERTSSGYRAMSVAEVRERVVRGESEGPVHERWAYECPKCGRRFERQNYQLVAALSGAADIGMSRIDMSLLG